MVKPMSLFFNSSGNNSGDYDFEKFRRDLVDEYGIQSASFSGGSGFLDNLRVHHGRKD